MRQVLSTLGALAFSGAGLWLVLGPEESGPRPDQASIDAVDPQAREQAEVYGQMARLIDLQGACIAARLSKQPAAPACDELADMQRALAKTGLPHPADALGQPASAPAASDAVAQQGDAE